MGDVPTMVERVAKAMCEERVRDEMVLSGAPQWEDHVAMSVRFGWEEFVPTARAAIAAMREPVEAVIAAVEKMAEERYNAASDMLRWYGEDVWAAGIDAALASPEPIERDAWGGLT